MAKALILDTLKKAFAELGAEIKKDKCLPYYGHLYLEVKQ